MAAARLIVAGVSYRDLPDRPGHEAHGVGADRLRGFTHPGFALTTRADPFRFYHHWS